MFGIYVIDNDVIPLIRDIADSENREPHYASMYINLNSIIRIQYNELLTKIFNSKNVGRVYNITFTDGRVYHIDTHQYDLILAR